MSRLAVLAVILWLRAALAADGGAPLPATCERPWRTSVSALSALRADDGGVVLCAATQAFPGEALPLPFPCARLDLATGRFSKEPWTTPNDPEAAPTAVEGARICRSGKCVALALGGDGGTGDEIATLHHDGTRAVVPLPAREAVGVFDARSGALVKMLETPGQCPSKALFLGDAVYVVASACTVEDEVEAWLFVGERKVKQERLLEFADDVVPPAVAHLRGNLWVLASHQPSRVEALDVTTGKRAWAVSLPQLDMPPFDDAALGATVFASTPAHVSTLVVTPRGEVVVVSSRGVAVLDGQGKLLKTLRFPSCTSPVGTGARRPSR